MFLPWKTASVASKDIHNCSEKSQASTEEKIIVKRSNSLDLRHTQKIKCSWNPLPVCFILESLALWAILFSCGLSVILFLTVSSTTHCIDHHQLSIYFYKPSLSCVIYGKPARVLFTRVIFSQFAYWTIHQMCCTQGHLDSHTDWLTEEVWPECGVLWKLHSVYHVIKKGKY